MQIHMIDRNNTNQYDSRPEQNMTLDSDTVNQCNEPKKKLEYC